MVSVPTVVWSSRESLCAQLVCLLQSSPRADTWLRARAVHLLGQLDTSGRHAGDLRELLLDAREPYEAREAVPLAGRWRPPWLKLSTEALSRLTGRTPPEPPHPTFPLTCVLFEAGLDEDAETLAREVLSAEPPERRASLLRNLRPGALTPRLQEWLFQRWWDEDRHVLATQGDRSAEENGLVSLVHRHRPGVWDVLAAWARHWPTNNLKWHVLPELSPDEQVRLLTSSPELRRRAVEALLLPAEALVAELGEDGLSRVLREVIRVDSLSCTAGRLIVEPPVNHAEAVALLGTWKKARPLLYSMLCSFELHVEARLPLLAALFDADREVASRWTLAASHHVENLPLSREGLRRASLRPIPEDRALFLRWLRDEDPRGQAHALEGLLGLGESGAGWRDRLESLARSDRPEVRLRAAAGLVREGATGWLESLRHTALDAEAPERDTAVRWLGVVDAEGSREALYQALRTPPISQEDDGYVAPTPRPEATEAAWALNRLGTPEDLSRLTDAWLSGRCDYWLVDELERHVLRQEGHPQPAPPWPWERVGDREHHLARRRRVQRREG
ncbi:hypothetical protein LXT21_21325 [Myxococcus sp. K38C18041901]|uniref:hypothetical protein n=1 Tax=Myxococcus guangdongensis TaxID=2906760 RepID=UPI0020A73CF4|nr:hypothetical protein [Myxococcus guangdongensis]MCP3061326.1 hypothetical protein [Myxococcus guangdongensis]